MARKSAVGNSQSEVNEIDAKARLACPEGVREDAAVIGREIEIIHRPRQVEIGIGVETLDEGRALMAQIALDLEVGIEGKGRVVAVLELAAEFAVQGLVRQIGDMRGHARDREPATRLGLGEIAAAPPVGIGHDRLPADLMEGDVLRGMARGRRDRQRRKHALRIARRPLQHLHAAHRAAGDAEQRVDAEPVDQHGLGADHVADRHDRQIEAHRACRSPDWSRPGRCVPMQPPSTLAQMTK